MPRARLRPSTRRRSPRRALLRPVPRHPLPPLRPLRPRRPRPAPRRRAWWTAFRWACLTRPPRPAAPRARRSAEQLHRQRDRQLHRCGPGDQRGVLRGGLPGTGAEHRSGPGHFPGAPGDLRRADGQPRGDCGSGLRLHRLGPRLRRLGMTNFHRPHSCNSNQVPGGVDALTSPLERALRSPMVGWVSAD